MAPGPLPVLRCNMIIDCLKWVRVKNPAVKTTTYPNQVSLWWLLPESVDRAARKCGSRNVWYFTH